MQLSVLTMLMQSAPEDAEMDKTMFVLNTKLAAIDTEKAGDCAYYLMKLKGEEFKVVMEETVTHEAEPEWWRLAKAKMLGEGRADAVEEGRESARSEELERDRATLYTLLYRLGVETGPQARARIEACTDPDELSSWITKAIGIRAADELFDDSTD